MKRSIYILILAIIISGCNLTAETNNAATATPPPTRTLPFATSVDSTDSNVTAASNVPNTFPDSTTTPPASASDDTTTGILCVAQTDWPEYTIQRGDNLTTIANRTRSTVDELIAANCLDNPNRIRVGTSIYVPNEPE